MSVKTVLPGRQFAAQTDSRWSPGVWADCPWDAIREGELNGQVFEFNFDTLPKTPATTEGNFGLFSQFTDTGGFINAEASLGGGWSFGSDGDNEGASIRSRSVPFRMDRNTVKNLWWEVRVKTSTIADTKHGILVGLMGDSALTATVPITAAGALADVNFVGFMRLEGDGDFFDTIYKADGVTAVTVQSDAAGIVADTYLKLGMRYNNGVDPFIADTAYTGAARYACTFYKDGLRLSSSKQIPAAQGTDFPNDVGLGLVFAVLNATATTPGNSVIQGVRIAMELP